MNKLFLCCKSWCLSMNLLLFGQTLKVLKYRGDFPGSPVVKALHFHCMGLIPGWGTKILQAAGHGQKKRRFFPSEISFLICYGVFYFLFNVILGNKKKKF